MTIGKVLMTVRSLRLARWASDPRPRAERTFPLTEDGSNTADRPAGLIRAHGKSTYVARKSRAEPVSSRYVVLVARQTASPVMVIAANTSVPL